jgi:hypothetical protein
MIQTVDDHISAPSPDETRKQRKKLAKHEAKLMLALEQVKGQVQKAEQKATKAQAKLEKRSTLLHKLEAQARGAKGAAVQAAGEAPTQDSSS